VKASRARLHTGGFAVDERIESQRHVRRCPNGVRVEQHRDGIHECGQLEQRQPGEHTDGDGAHGDAVVQSTGHEPGGHGGDAPSHGDDDGGGEQPDVGERQQRLDLPGEIELDGPLHRLKHDPGDDGGDSDGAEEAW
jgi:hypothetical protein